MTARLDDPVTSHEAAASVNVSATQVGILWVLTTAAHDYTDDELTAVYQSVAEVFGWPQATPQSIRSRRAELARRGLVVQGADSETQHGRRCRTWRIA